MGDYVYRSLSDPAFFKSSFPQLCLRCGEIIPPHCPHLLDDLGSALHPVDCTDEVHTALRKIAKEIEYAQAQEQAEDEKSTEVEREALLPSGPQ